MTVNFKYKVEMETLSMENITCPPESLEDPVGLIAFRYIFEDIHHPNNHKPAGVVNPSRLISEVDRKKCSLFGLSCFKNKDSAKSFYIAICKNFSKLPEKVGSHLSEGILDSNDGLITPEDANTHFDLFEFIGCDLSKKFIVVEKLI